MALIRKLGTALLAVTMAVTWVGCGQNNAKNNARINSLDTPGASNGPKINRESAGVLARQDLDHKLNATAGLRNATVLVHDGNAYVGVVNVGKEHTPDMAMQSGDNWNDMPWGTPQSPNTATGMSVQQMQAEGLEPAHTHEGPYSTISGNIDDATKQKITDIVRANVKGVQQVYITANVDQVQKLSGYKHYIARGGNMTPHLQEFSQFIQSTFGGNTSPQMQP
ncbi:hypothetical protein [Tumebacillus permanentifrigoris]|uniref:YhcN/YlaJ family sporulation lipoprotein n=1 Tax=Tumebacillus permanentifrigoris TaxID=378543 RepID=A0A316DAT9_9BACL|nr:hypothetical protein [Tumebacillus permanentifrigoris]PWK13810.1 hypothetical protein C7459_10690 [Tumebacillus permanentifrigoris]